VPDKNSVTVALPVAASNVPQVDKFGVPRVQKIPR